MKHSKRSLPGQLPLPIQADHDDPTMATRRADTPTIVSDPAVMMGKPVIAGTRITVEPPR